MHSLIAESYVFPGHGYAFLDDTLYAMPLLQGYSIVSQGQAFVQRLYIS